MKKINSLNYAAYLTLVAMLSLASAISLSPALAGDAVAAAQAVTQPLEPRWLFSSGLWRRYWVQVPPDYSPTEPTSVVVGFHGGFGNAQGFAESNSLAQASADRGYLAVFPEGTRRPWPSPPDRRFWNGGNCCGIAMQEDVDDVQFFRDLLDDLSLQFNVDPARVYATGMSNGAMMSYRLALEASDLVAAIAPVAGALGVHGAPSVPVPVVAFHGVLDQNIPFWGGVGIGVSSTDFFSQVDSIGPFIDVNQCDPLSATRDVIGNAIRYLFPSLTGHDIEYWLLQDGGHSWPGSFNPSEPVNRDIDASEVMLDFFDAHVRS